MKTIDDKSFYFIVILAMLGALPPFATDTYTPAIPQIASYFSISQSSVMLSITTYFIGFSLGMLIWGPLSDYYGRKKTLIIGIGLYLISSIICSFSWNYEVLLFMRFFQGASDSSGVVVALAIARDCYSGRKLTTVMASVMIVQMIAPISAPIIGSFLIVFTGQWQNIFHFLTVYGAILFFFIFFLKETHPKYKRNKLIINNISFYKDHLLNVHFILKSLISGLCFAGFFSFIGSSSIIYLSKFSVSYLLYCLLFAFNILGMVAANILLKYKLHTFNEKPLIRLGYLGLALGLVLSFMFNILYSNVYLFTLGIMLMTFGFGLISIIYSSAALSSVSNGFGVATSINNFIKFFLGGAASFLMSYSSVENIITDLSMQQLGIVILSLISLVFIKFAGMHNGGMKKQ
jgi:MFS transporter, DHA1 family, multidrug resistance protein